MNFRFAYPAVLLLLLAPPVMYLIQRRLRWRVGAAALRYADVRLVEGLPVSWRVRLRWLPDALRLGAWLLLVVALARPQSGRSQEVIRGQGIDIVLALDISGSMAALDFAPQNRLDAAKDVISSFVAGRRFDRIGLVVFAHNAFQQVPPTLDYPTLLRALGSVGLATQLGIGDGTAIGLGLASSANLMRSDNTASKIIILLTDGANNAGGLGPVTAAQMVAALNMRVYTIGMGKTGLVPVPVDDAGNTQMVESDLDEPTLQAVAATTGGRYFRAEDLGDLQRVYDEINRLERSDVQQQIYVRWQELAWPLLWGAAVCLLIERLLRQTVLQTLP
jgi:Ca-activated chloride channel family protein